MKHIQFPNKLDEKKEIKIFLAGTCKSNWRNDLIASLSQSSCSDDLVILNPYDSNWSESNIQWEIDSLLEADYTIFNFEFDALGRNSYMELGICLGMSMRDVFICIDDRRTDYNILRTYIKTLNPFMRIYDSISNLETDLLDSITKEV